MLLAKGKIMHLEREWIQKEFFRLHEKTFRMDMLMETVTLLLER